MDDIFIEKASIKAITNYLNKDFSDEEVKENFSYALELVKSNFNNLCKSNNTIQSMTQGSRSVTYKQGNCVIDDNIKNLLPKPYIKLF